MALSDNQVFLLNLLYYSGSNDLIVSAANDGMSVQDMAGEMLRRLEAREARGETVGDEFQSAAEMKTGLRAILADPTLCQMQVARAKQEPNGSLHFIVVTPEGQGPREAVVVHEGTASTREWIDNFTMGGPTNASDGVSTEVQEEMLQWYRDQNDILSQCDIITTTGHSKGGNTAQYIALLDPSVDRCISFDGPGFSDEFYAKYGDLIAARQDRIKNYSADRDYVNILLNKVGESRYIKSQRTDGNFLKNHSLYALLDLQHPETSLTDGITQQDNGLNQLDQLLNSYLRTLPPREKVATLKILGQIVAGLRVSDGGKKITVEEIIRLMSEDGNPDLAGRLITYIVQYFWEHPESVNDIIRLLDEICPGLGSLLDKIREVFETATHNPLFQLIAPELNFIWDIMSWLMQQGWFQAMLDKVLALFNISPEIRKLVIEAMAAGFRYSGKHEIADGRDLSVPSGGGADVITVDVSRMEAIASTLRQISAELEALAPQARSTASFCGTHDMLFFLSPIAILKALVARYTFSGTPEAILNRIADSMVAYSNYALKLSDSLIKASEMCREMEERNTRSFNSLCEGT